MVTLVIVYMGFLTVALLWYMLRQYRRGTHDLLSLRNFALLGFIIFQVSGAIGSLSTGGSRTAFMLSSPGTTSLIYAVMVTVFIVVALWTYEKASVSEYLAGRTPVTRAVPGQAMLWMLAAVLVVLAAVLRLGVNIPHVSQLANPIGVASAAAACGIVGWIWGQRLLNPGVLLGAVLICIGAAAVVTTGAFGRRGLVALGAALLWGMYYSHWRYLIPQVALKRIALISIVPLIVVAAFTSVRQSGVVDRTAAEHFREVRYNMDLTAGFVLLVGGQDAAQNSLWLIEQYPGNFQTRPLFTLYHLAIYPVPREWWPGKPAPLTVLLPHMAAVPNVNRDKLTLGAGIIGHAAAEGGWLALLIYAIAAGLAFRYLDGIVQYNAWSPLVVVAIGTSFGNVIGLARGETSSFAALFIIGVTGVYILMLIIGKCIESLTGASAEVYTPEHEQEWAATSTPVEPTHVWEEYPAQYWHYPYEDEPQP